MPSQCGEQEDPAISALLLPTNPLRFGSIGVLLYEIRLMIWQHLMPTPIAQNELRNRKYRYAPDWGERPRPRKGFAILRTNKCLWAEIVPELYFVVRTVKFDLGQQRALVKILNHYQEQLEVVYLYQMRWTIPWQRFEALDITIELPRSSTGLVRLWEDVRRLTETLATAPSLSRLTISTIGHGEQWSQEDEKRAPVPIKDPSGRTVSAIEILLSPFRLLPQTSHVQINLPEGLDRLQCGLSVERSNTLKTILLTPGGYQGLAEARKIRGDVYAHKLLMRVAYRVLGSEIGWVYAEWVGYGGLDE